uniref:Uncharacterized protein n=1 Tax=Cannabis sativa TaxID=3483 RepID=A0A803QWL4_CANSA
MILKNFKITFFLISLSLSGSFLAQFYFENSSMASAIPAKEEINQLALRVLDRRKKQSSHLHWQKH